MVCQAPKTRHPVMPGEQIVEEWLNQTYSGAQVIKKSKKRPIGYTAQHLFAYFRTVQHFD